MVMALDTPGLAEQFRGALGPQVCPQRGLSELCICDSQAVLSREGSRGVQVSQLPALKIDVYQGSAVEAEPVTCTWTLRKASNSRVSLLGHPMLEKALNQEAGSSPDFAPTRPLCDLGTAPCSIPGRNELVSGPEEALLLSEVQSHRYGVPEFKCMKFRDLEGFALLSANKAFRIAFGTE
ncbi:hypothetical protein MJT46_011648 [Ovis ammon polii x Ovis aries]|nr:hypothetical protein MJT46_011648 [Ovis ammon polii x Ovis aries]